MKKLALMFFISSFIVYLVTSAGHTPYDYFTRLSDSFLQGKYYLEDNPPWLNELIPDNGKFYIPYPPMPAIVALPFRFFLDGKFYQDYLAHLMGALIVALTVAISWTIKKDSKLAIWAGLLAGFGNILWFLSSVGSSWYIGQVSSALFMTLAIYLSLKKKSPFLIGLALGAMYLSRVHTVLALPLFLYFTFDKKNWFRNYFYLGLGILPFIAFNFYYNFIRFRVVWDKAYALIPGVLEEPWYKEGLVNFKNIPNHLRTIFYSFPRLSNEFPYITPSWAGLSIWITTPAFIYSLFGKMKDKSVIFSWISITLISLLIFSHGTTGFTQFGYRFAVDFYPILFYLTIKNVSRGNLKWHHWLLLYIAIIVNSWGVTFINKFNWVGF